jgi:hypothetical protein
MMTAASTREGDPMARRKVNLLKHALALVAGWAAVMALAAACHAMGFASSHADHGYAFTAYLQNCIGIGSAAVFLLLSVALGCIFRVRVSIAFGMMMPWPIALAMEFARDQTTHNLLPFEVVFIWLPVFMLALLGTYIGRMIVWYFVNNDRPRLGLTDQQ